MNARASTALIVTAFIGLIVSVPVLAQRGMGELRLHVTDATGAPVQASVTLVSEASHIRQAFTTGAGGTYVATDLPFGVYSLQIRSTGFDVFSTVIEVRSEVPMSVPVTLTVAALQATVTVTNAEAPTLLDPHRPGSVTYLGADVLGTRPLAAPGRSILDLVSTQPGWLLEANGVLHPRGSEYQVQYVVDGIPFRDNRSPAFAQSLDLGQFESMTVRTAGYPAEYGGKLGGVIEVTSVRDSREGFHGVAAAQAGSFAAFDGSFLAQHVAGRTSAAVSGDAMRTNRYLDPPVEQNYTNHGAGGGVAGYFERDWSNDDRTRLSVQRRWMNFLVPNESLQEVAGQRQNRSAGETLAYVIHEHVFSPQVFGGVRFMARDNRTSLDANAASTPIRPTQQRGFREAYVNGTVSAHYGIHELKAGGEATLATIDERFASAITAYRLNGLRIFDRDLPQTFAFSGRRRDREQSAFIQDQMRLGRLTASAGVRYDHYRLIADEQAISPRLSASFFVAPANLVLHASYDRTFQPPAVENVILASSDLVESLGGEGRSLPLRSSRGNFYEAGISKAWLDRIRIDASYFLRSASNFADDDLLLNTAVSFPIAFAHARVNGYEAKLDLRPWGPWSGSLSYSHSVGVGQLPLAGGLFLGDDVEALLNSAEKFPLSQDQRHTLRANVRHQITPRAWIAGAFRYDSGLPVEVDGPVDTTLFVQQYGAAIVNRVDFEGGRVRPSSAVDASLSIDLFNRSDRAIRLRADAFNLTNRLNVINFAGLLSDTAVAPRRTFAVRLQTVF